MRPFVQFFDWSCMLLNYVNCLSVNVHCSCKVDKYNYLVEISHVIRNYQWLLAHIKLGYTDLGEQIQCGAFITRSIFHKYSQKKPYSSPVRARYGVSFVDPASDWYSASVAVIIYIIYCYIGPRYNGTRLFCFVFLLPTANIFQFLKWTNWIMKIQHVLSSHQILQREIIGYLDRNTEMYLTQVMSTISTDITSTIEYQLALHSAWMYVSGCRSLMFCHQR